MKPLVNVREKADLSKCNQRSCRPRSQSESPHRNGQRVTPGLDNSEFNSPQAKTTPETANPQAKETPGGVFPAVCKGKNGVGLVQGGTWGRRLCK